MAFGPGGKVQSERGGAIWHVDSVDVEDVHCHRLNSAKIRYDMTFKASALTLVKRAFTASLIEELEKKNAGYDAQERATRKPNIGNILNKPTRPE